MAAEERFLRVLKVLRSVLELTQPDPELRIFGKEFCRHRDQRHFLNRVLVTKRHIEPQLHRLAIGGIDFKSPFNVCPVQCVGARRHFRSQLSQRRKLRHARQHR